jgi:hypothetical protein
MRVGIIEGDEFQHQIIGRSTGHRSDRKGRSKTRNPDYPHHPLPPLL